MHAFAGAPALEFVTLYCTQVPNRNHGLGKPEYTIYVPEELVAGFKDNGNWNNANIQPIAGE
jgi:hypothetical protein